MFQPSPHRLRIILMYIFGTYGIALRESQNLCYERRKGHTSSKELFLERFSEVFAIPTEKRVKSKLENDRKHAEKHLCLSKLHRKMFSESRIRDVSVCFE